MFLLIAFVKLLNGDLAKRFSMCCVVLYAVKLHCLIPSCCPLCHHAAVFHSRPVRWFLLFLSFLVSALFQPHTSPSQLSVGNACSQCHHSLTIHHCFSLLFLCFAFQISTSVLLSPVSIASPCLYVPPCQDSPSCTLPHHCHVYLATFPFLSSERLYLSSHSAFSFFFPDVE